MIDFIRDKQRSNCQASVSANVQAFDAPRPQLTFVQAPKRLSSKPWVLRDRPES